MIPQFEKKNSPNRKNLSPKNTPRNNVWFHPISFVSLHSKMHILINTFDYYLHLMLHQNTYLILFHNHYQIQRTQCLADCNFPIFISFVIPIDLKEQKWRRNTKKEKIARTIIIDVKMIAREKKKRIIINFYYVLWLKDNNMIWDVVLGCEIEIIDQGRSYMDKNSIITLWFISRY